MTIEKTIALTRRTLVGKEMPLLFNMLSRFGIAFLPRSKHLLLSWLQSSSAVILEPNKIKSLTVSIVPPSVCHEVMGPDAMIFIFFFFLRGEACPEELGEEDREDEGEGVWTLGRNTVEVGTARRFPACPAESRARRFWVPSAPSDLAVAGSALVWFLLLLLLQRSLVGCSPWDRRVAHDWAWSSFFECCFKPAFSLSSFTFIKRLFSSFSLSATRVVSSAYLSLLIFLSAIMIPACVSSSLSFHTMSSTYKLNKQGDNIQPWCTPFPIWNQLLVHIWF